MAKKIGICVNIDCDNYKKEVEVEPGGEFECPLCHQPLKEGKSSKKDPDDSGKKSKLGLIVGGNRCACSPGWWRLLFHERQYRS